MAPPALPKPAVASAPVLQCVYMRVPGVSSEAAFAAIRRSASS